MLVSNIVNLQQKCDFAAEVLVCCQNGKSSSVGIFRQELFLCNVLLLTASVLLNEV